MAFRVKVPPVQCVTFYGPLIAPSPFFSCSPRSKMSPLFFEQILLCFILNIDSAISYVACPYCNPGNGFEFCFNCLSKFKEKCITRDIEIG